MRAFSSLVDLGDWSAKPDASNDASNDADADADADASAPFCMTQPKNRVFCADFDEQPYFAGFTTSLDDASDVSDVQ